MLVRIQEQQTLNSSDHDSIQRNFTHKTSQSNYSNIIYKVIVGIVILILFLKQESTDKKVAALAQGFTQLQSRFDQLQKKQTIQLVQYSERYTSFKNLLNLLHTHVTETFHQNKIGMLKSMVVRSDILRGGDEIKTSFFLAFKNYKNVHENVNMDRERKQLLAKDYERLSKLYDFTLPQLPFCIVVPTINNAKDFRYQYNLQSLMSLNYKNLKVIIIDDASTDQTGELIKSFIKENPSQIQFHVQISPSRKFAVLNIYSAVKQFCGVDDIVSIVDGDDQLLSPHIFKVFNHIYQTTNAKMVYSNHFQLDHSSRTVFKGYSAQYSKKDIKDHSYRSQRSKVGHLQTFMANLYLKIKEQDLKDEQGEWLKACSDVAIYLPMLQMACGKVQFVEQYFYLYNFQIGNNVYDFDKDIQKEISNYIASKPKYQCLET